GLHATDTGLVIYLDEGETDWLPAGPAAQPRTLLPAMTAPPIVGRDGRTVAAVGVGGQVHVVDLPSLSRWTLPVRLESQQSGVDVSASGRLAQLGHDAVALWTLPRPGSDFAAWLDEQSNATEPQDVLVWPWQQPGRP